jgi:hypothetical protein
MNGKRRLESSKKSINMKTPIIHIDPKRGLKLIILWVFIAIIIHLNSKIREVERKLDNMERNGELRCSKPH